MADKKYKSFIQLVNEAVEEMENNDLYQKFKTNQSFRYKAVNILAKNGYLVHGTNDEFAWFDKSKIKGGFRGNYGYGFYFTDAAYKCEEYGSKYIFLDAKDFNFLDFNQKTIDNETIMGTLNKIKTITDNIDNAQAQLYNVIRREEYEYYENEIKKLKSDYNQILPDSKSEIFFRIIMEDVRNKKDMTNRDLVASLNNQFGNNLGEEFVSNMFLKLGFDGFHYDAEYVIFNFDKLNKNIVKDRNGLLNQLMG